MSTGLGISVLICCYNSEKRIVPTLEHLSRLKSDGIGVEIILVNNASTDHTANMACKTWESLHGPYNLKIMDQPIPGVMAAREKGMEAARYDHILFCDDDNWLDENYLLYAHKILVEYPDVAVIGGRAIGEYEITPRHWFLGCTGALAIGPQADASKLVNKPVYGAGCVVNKTIYHSLRAMGFESILSGRKGKALVSGEDTELCQAYLAAGYTIYYEEEMCFRHFMPESRMDKKYIMNLCLSGVHSDIVLSMYDYMRKEGYDFEDFYDKECKRYRKNYWYYGLRSFLGKYRFYAHICFKQSLKAIRLLKEVDEIKQDFNSVSKNMILLRKQLKT